MEEQEVVIHRAKGWTHITNNVLQDKRLSFKARGLMAFMLSVQNIETWNYSIAGLQTKTTDKRVSIQAGLKELEKYGYLIRKQGHFNGKFTKNIYHLFEEPLAENLQAENLLAENLQAENLQQKNNNINKLLNKENTNILCEKPFDNYKVPRKPYIKKQYMDKPYIEKPYMENHMQLNTNELNTNILCEKPKRQPKQFIPPTLEQVEEYAKSRNSVVKAKNFFDYYDAGNWVDASGKPVKAWKQKFIQWEMRENEKQGIKEKVESKLPKAQINRFKHLLDGTLKLEQWSNIERKVVSAIGYQELMYRKTGEEEKWLERLCKKFIELGD